MHTTEKKPFEIAREALIRLSARKLPPTPVNFQAVYAEIAGTPDAAPFPDAPLRAIAQAMPAKTGLQRQQRGAFERAVEARDWGSLRDAVVGCCLAAGASGEPPAVSQGHGPGRALTDLFEPLARIVENALPALGTDDARFAALAEQLLRVLRSAPSDLTRLRATLGDFTHRLSFVAEDQAEVRGTLLRLIRVIVDGIGELCVDDPWLKRQIDPLAAAAAPPLTLRRLDDLERRLRDVMIKQIDARGRMLEAQEQTRRMLAAFVERLAAMSDSTGAFHGRMEASARLLEQAKSLEEVGPVLKDVIGATRALADEVHATREQLRAMRDKVDTAQAEVAQLRRELDAESSRARHDVLTGALNRKGLEEALAREVADVRRKETPLCVALLDIDNFKKLNDTRGHETGDAALTHLATVTRECMRGQDTLARYGGEEFVILMPDTELDDGLAAMVRLQRALTRNYFLAGTEKLLITFSAGVARFAPEETAEDAIRRADQAMYLAKRQGKNRVVAG